MSKEIKCGRCGCVVGVLEKGSKWKKFSIAICNTCNSKASSEKTKKANPFNKYNSGNDFMNRLKGFM